MSSVWPGRSFASKLCRFSQVDVELIDIADDDELVDLYGVKIPVLRCSNSQKVLCWPFDECAINDF